MPHVKGSFYSCTRTWDEKRKRVISNRSHRTLEDLFTSISIHTLNNSFWNVHIYTNRYTHSHIHTRTRIRTYLYSRLYKIHIFLFSAHLASYVCIHIIINHHYLQHSTLLLILTIKLRICMFIYLYLYQCLSVYTFNYLSKYLHLSICLCVYTFAYT